jgi:hypothetical protein
MNANNTSGNQRNYWNSGRNTGNKNQYDPTSTYNPTTKEDTAYASGQKAESNTTGKHRHSNTPGRYVTTS